MQENLTDVALELSDRLKAARNNGQYSEEIGATVARLITSEGFELVDALAALSVCRGLIQQSIPCYGDDSDKRFILGQSQILLCKALEILEMHTGISSGCFVGFETIPPVAKPTGEKAS